MKNIVIFASGEGTNAECICRYFESSKEVRVRAIICNRKEAGIYNRAKRLGIAIHYFNKSSLESPELLDLLASLKTDLIVLAGFMCLVPKSYFNLYKHRIVNIHPALLPKFGGKGMYGDHVHEAVIKAQEPISGITIHVVDEQYDHGRALCQATCPVTSDDTVDTLAARIHKLEHRYYPTTIEQYLTELEATR
ncbi:phosphoribosylglycinamide formyltransferase [Falsiporphyromonas endometrii]|uniref:Phosphoribosylglycinamide formyltransferase n=1 Tax=Falsiporphyromonas endometrii TaxID=1387297 RepID=A0ABV9K781_9PORP